MAELVLLRHGRTDWNASRRIQGQLESELDELGRAQAAAVAPVMAALRPTVLWSSDSGRARETAAAVAVATGLSPTYDARLREYHLGPREGLFHHEFEADDPGEYAAFRRGNWDAVVGAEKRADVTARMLAVLGEVARTAGEHGVGVVVAHGASIRTAVGALLGWPDDQADSLRGMANCGWAHLDRVDPDAPWRLRAYNRVAL